MIQLMAIIPRSNDGEFYVNPAHIIDFELHTSENSNFKNPTDYYSLHLTGGRVIAISEEFFMSIQAQGLVKILTTDS